MCFHTPSCGYVSKHVLTARPIHTSVTSENSNSPPMSINGHARHLAAVLPSTSNANQFLWSATRNQKSTLRHLAAAFTSTSLPSDLPIVHVSRFSKFQFFPPNPHARHLAAAFTIHKRSPSSGRTRNHVHTQPLSFFKILTQIHVPLPAI